MGADIVGRRHAGVVEPVMHALEIVKPGGKIMLGGMNRLGQDDPGLQQ